MKILKTILFGTILGLGILGASSCSKEDNTTPCPNSPISGQSLCGQWLNLTTTDSLTTEIWSIYKDVDNKPKFDIILTYNGVESRNTIPFSIGADTTFTRYDIDAGTGSANITYKISVSLDTLILTNFNQNPAIQKFIEL